MSDLFGLLGTLTVPAVEAKPVNTWQSELASYQQHKKAEEKILASYQKALSAQTVSAAAARMLRTAIKQTRDRIRLYSIAIERTTAKIGKLPGERDVKAYIRTLFTNYGLPASLADWAYDVLVQGASGAEMVQRMYDRPEFKERFKALFEYRKRNPNLPAIGPGEILAYEREASALMRASGMPPAFYDHWSDFVEPIASGMSMQELSERVQGGFERVANAPRGVREAFTSFFGPSGDAALAAVFIDPERALPALRTQVRAAEAAGAGFTFGFTLGRERAIEIAESGYDYGAAQDRFANLFEIAPLFSETVGEAKTGPDLEAAEEGVEAVFGLTGGGDSMRALERRREERVAAFSGGGGAQGTSQLGARGLDSAD